MPHAGSRPPPWLWVALLGCVLALGGCLQDARNQNKDFTFDNAQDPTPVSGTSSTSGIAIVSVDYLSATQTLVIVNSTSSSQDMTGWAVLNQTTSDKYTFGTFTLAVGGYVRLHAAKGTDNGADLYSGDPGKTSPKWQNANVAVLQNATGNNVSSCTVGSPTC